MTTTQRIVLGQNNDETLQTTITSHDSTPSDGAQNITGMQLDFYIKTTENTPDTDPATVHLSTLTGEIVLTNPTAGIAQISVARTHLQTPGNMWYRLDVLASGQLKTAGNGPLVVGAQ
jgi:hypothetical protein